MREYVRLALPDGKPARAFRTGCPRTTVLHLKGREEIRANGEWRRAARERGWRDGNTVVFGTRLCKNVFVRDTTMSHSRLKCVGKLSNKLGGMKRR